MCMGVLLAYVSMQHLCAVSAEAKRWCHHLQPEYTQCEPKCGFWALNLGHLEEEAVLLTAETALQALPTVI